MLPHGDPAESGNPPTPPARPIPIRHTTTRHRGDVEHVSRLGRILKEVAAEGTESDVVFAVLEALAVWHDVESWGYVESLAGPMVREVSLPGADNAAAPPLIPRDGLLPAAGVAVLDARDRRDLAFPADREVLLLMIRPRIATPWRIAMGRPEWCDEAMVADYGRSVTAALDELAAVELSRTAWALLQHLLPDTDSCLEAAHRAIAELSTVMKRPVGLAVHSHDGRALLMAGDAEPLALAPPTRSPQVIALPLDADLPIRAVLGARGSHGRLLRPRDERLLRAAAAPLASWLRNVAPRLTPVQERRSRLRTFEDLVQQYELNAAKLRHDVSMIIVSVADRVRVMNRTQAWVGHIRQQLRPSDLAGQLSGGDIGILLPQTSRDEAQIVAERLRRLIRSNEGFAPLASAPIGFATSSVDAPVPLSLLSAARPESSPVASEFYPSAGS
jgi:hypothetical protein